MKPRQFEFSLQPFTLECGVKLPHLPVRGWVWGPEGDWSDLSEVARVLEVPNGLEPVSRSRREMQELPRVSRAPQGANVPTVLIIHALTGDSAVGGPGGWWEPLVGPGRPLDPSRMRILCFNNLGSCYGTFGPSDTGFPSLRQVEGPRRDLEEKGGFASPELFLPAPITTWDGARTLLLALDALGVQEVEAVIGGSVGGLLALTLGALAPTRVRQVLPLAAAGASSPWVIGWNHIGRQLALMDARRGLELARQLAHMTYRAEPGLDLRQGRTPASGGEGWAWPYAMQSYLEHQGTKLRKRFERGAYLSQLDLMDHHDLARSPKPPEAHESWTWSQAEPAGWGWGRLTSEVHALSIEEDQLFPPRQSEALVATLHELGRTATHHSISHPQGHDGFLLATEEVGQWIRRLLQPTLRRCA